MSEQPEVTPARAPRPGRRRAVIVLVSLPFALASLVVVAKLAGLPVLGGAMVDQYRSDDFVASIESADRLTEGNLFESWIAPFGRGTATAAAGDYNAAIPDLELALELAPESRRCDVAVNLSLSWEALGDSYVAQGLDAGALRLYATAKRVITSAGEACLSPNAPPNVEEGRNAGDELSDASDRLDDKIDGSATPPPESTDPPSPTPESDQLDELREQNGAGAEEKAQQQGLDRGQQSGAGFTDRPW